MLQNRSETKTKRQGISKASLNNEKIKLLMPHFTIANLKVCFHELPANRAGGIDEQTKEQYAAKLEENLRSLITRLKSMTYFPKPTRRVMIPKDKDKFRPLDIPSIEDKIVQAMIKKSLEAIYEPLFLDCSYGYRPDKGPLDAVKATRNWIQRFKVSYIHDLDLSNFFGEINHDKLLKLLEMRISDKRFVRYIARFLKAGYSFEGRLHKTGKGSAQGSLISPILSNIYAHYCFDKWFEEEIKPNLSSQAKMIRFADDICVIFLSSSDAGYFKSRLKERLTKFDLILNENKSRFLTINKLKVNKQKQPSFDFLGFTFYLGKTKYKDSAVMVKTSNRKFRKFLVELNRWLKLVRCHLKIKEIYQGLLLRLKGHLNYFAVSFNSTAICKIIHFARRLLFKWLNRRSQKKSFTWLSFNKYLQLYPMPNPRIVHSLV